MVECGPSTVSTQWAGVALSGCQPAAAIPGCQRTVGSLRLGRDRCGEHATMRFAPSSWCILHTSLDHRPAVGVAHMSHPTSPKVCTVGSQIQAFCSVIWVYLQPKVIMCSPPRSHSPVPFASLVLLGWTVADQLCQDIHVLLAGAGNAHIDCRELACLSRWLDYVGLHHGLLLVDTRARPQAKRQPMFRALLSSTVKQMTKEMV